VKLKLPATFSPSRAAGGGRETAVTRGQGIVMEVPASEHIIKYAYQWSLEKAVDLSVEATRYAKSRLYWCSSHRRLPRRDGWYLNTMERVATEGHMDALALVDTFGVLSPTRELFRARDAEADQEAAGDPLPHGLRHGVANTIIALAPGRRGPFHHQRDRRAGGNVPTEDTLLSLLTMYGWTPGSRRALTKLSRYVRKMRSWRWLQPADRGDTVYDIESGIIASWFRTRGGAHAGSVPGPLDLWAAAGQGGAGKNSGLDSIKMHLQRLRVKANDDQVNELVLRVKTPR